MRLLLTLVSMLCAVSAWAAGPPNPVGGIAPRFGFGVHGNFTVASLPGPAITGSKSLADAYGPGWGGGAHLEVGLMGLSLRLSGDYLKYPLDQGRFRDSVSGVLGVAPDQISIEGGGLGVTSFSANAKVAVMPLPLVRPYVTGGAGLAWLSMDETKTSITGRRVGTFPAARQDGRRSYNLGAGADLDFGVTLFLEARYVWVLTEGEKSTYVPVALGVTF
jgi:opacity protein-like surface antigen